MNKFALVSLLLLFCIHAEAQKKGKSKAKIKSEPSKVNYDMPDAEPDSTTRFTGIIKYLITTDDVADKDSMIVIVGESQLRIVMFIPGYRADQVFETHMIARFSDSTLLTLDDRNKTYKSEKMTSRNAGTEIALSYFKKQGIVLKYNCLEFNGEMTLPDGETFKADCLVSKQHSSNSIADYNFLNIQPIIVGYKIVLGWRTKSTENENTLIMAYKIEPGNTDSYFILDGYKQK